EKTKAEPAEKPKGRSKGKATTEQATSALQGSSETGEAQKGQKATAGQGCPVCNSGDYVFRGRRAVPPQPGEEGAVLETKRCCRTCGHEWKVRVQEGVRRGTALDESAAVQEDCGSCP